MKEQIITILKNDDLSQSAKITAIDDVFKENRSDKETIPYIPGYREPDTCVPYWTISYFDNYIIEAHKWKGHINDYVSILLGNVFKTGEEAQAKLEQLIAYKKFITAIAVENEQTGFKVDWNNYKQSKCCFVYSYRDEIVKDWTYEIVGILPDREYFTENSAESLRKILGIDLIKQAIIGR